MAYPLYVALVWHMHQPYYKDGHQTGEYVLPWVRLHAVKDYLHMAEVLAGHPGIGTEQRGAELGDPAVARSP